MTDVSTSAPLPPGVMGEESVGWWHWDVAQSGNGGLNFIDNRVRKPNRDIRGVGNVLQSDPDLRPTRSGSNITFADDYLVSQSGVIVEQGELPQLWLVASPSESPATTRPGLFSLFLKEKAGGPGGARGLSVGYLENSSTYAAEAFYANGQKSVALLPAPSDELRLIVVKMLPTQVQLQIGDEVAMGTPDDPDDPPAGDGIKTDMSYTMFGGRWEQGESFRTLRPWTGRLNEAFLSRSNATSAQELQIRQYFERLYPEITA